MKFTNYILIFSFFILLGLASLIVPVRVFSADTDCYDCMRYNPGNVVNCLNICWPSCQSTGWTSTSLSDCSAISKVETCCASSGGCGSSCGNISQWDWCHAVGCQKKADLYQEGACLYQYNYTYTSCGATDSCRNGTGLLAGLCTGAGCGVGGMYKTCCNNGHVEYCNGGDHSGTCPHETVMCGWGGHPSCGPEACASEVVVPTVSPDEPTPTPKPAPGCGGDCNWWEDEHNDCGWCTDKDDCMRSGMCNKSWSKDQNTAAPGDPPNGYCFWKPGYPDQGRCCGCKGNPPPCVPNCSCAADTCVGSTCSNRCGGKCAGKKCCKTPPSQPSCRLPAKGDRIYNDSTILIWEDPEKWGSGCPDSYSFNINFGSIYPPPLFQTGLPVNPKNFSVSNLVDGNYFWQVQAVNNGELSPWSGICDFVIRFNFSPWWQAKDGAVSARYDIISPVSELAAPPFLMLSGDNEGMPGVVTYGERLSVDTGDLSETDWQAETDLTSNKSFDYLANRLKVERKDSSFDGDLESAKEGILYVGGEEGLPLELSRADLGTKKIIVFSEKNVKVKGDITVEPGGFFALISKGNITFASEVEKVHGFYLADKMLIVASGATPQTGPFDVQLKGEGSFIGREGISLRRNLGEKTDNRTTPAEFFEPRPDLYFNAPRNFTWSSFLFQELAP